MIAPVPRKQCGEYGWTYHMNSIKYYGNINTTKQSTAQLHDYLSHCVIVAQWCHVATYTWVNIGSSNPVHHFSMSSTVFTCFFFLFFDEVLIWTFIDVDLWNICLMLLRYYYQLSIQDPWQLAISCPTKSCICPSGWWVFKFVWQNGNGLVLSGIKQLLESMRTEPMRIYYQWGSVAFTLGHFHWKDWSYQFIKWKFTCKITSLSLRRQWINTLTKGQYGHHFPPHFLEWKCRNFNSNFTEIDFS